MTGSPTSPKAGLIDRDRSCLVVIDVQKFFLDKLPLDQRQPLVDRIGWIMRVATALAIPIIATAEDSAHDGPLVPDLAGLLPKGQTVFNKMVFGLAGQPDIRATIEGSRCDTFVLVGLETDVCVAHSAFGLRDLGNRTVVISDATGSPPPYHEAGLARLRDAGITVTTVKGLYYEWVRDLATHARVKAAINQPSPYGLTL